MQKHILLFIVFIFLIQACTPGEAQNPTESLLDGPTQAAPAATPLPEFPSLDPQDWINSQPFLEAPIEKAGMASTGFPEGYESQEIGYQTANLPTSGLEVQVTEIVYEHPIDGQVYTKDSVKVQVSSHQNLEARSEHLSLLIGSEDSWEYRQVSDHITARFYSESADGRIWISGPYMVAVWSSLDISAGDLAVDPMVDTFTAIYLELYPPN